jgi:hypothetical protein
MPYRKSARFTVTNEGTQDIGAFYSNIDYQTVPSLPADALYFHAQYRQAAPCVATTGEEAKLNLNGQLNYVYGQTRGRGHLMGVTLGVLQNADGWWGEGDEMIFIDDDRKPEGHETRPDLGASIRIRVGVPLVARGPAPNIADAGFTEIQLPSGLFRGFTAAGTTFAIDGTHPYDMGGPAATVLKPGPAGSPSSCGQWITHVELEGKTLFGWVHNETACDYAKSGQTHASMSIATSTDYGLTWKILGPIIRGTDPPAAKKETGDSCMTAIRGQDGYDYAYCLHNGGHSWDGGYTFIARAPASDPGPGKWKKYFNGSWSEPGVDGKSSPIDGAGVAYWTTTGETVGLKWVKGGLGLSASTDRLHFAAVLPQPIMSVEPGDWSRKNGWNWCRVRT